MESGSISLNEIFNDFLELILQNTGNLLLILIWCFNNVLKHQRKRLIKLYHASPLCVQATIRYSIAWHHNCFINVLKNHAQHILTLSKSQCLRKCFLIPFFTVYPYWSFLDNHEIAFWHSIIIRTCTVHILVAIF